MHSKVRILSQATDLYLSGGLNGVSMRKVADQCEISATAIYRHYKDKEELLQHMVAEGFKIFGRYLKRSYVEADARTNLFRGLEAYKRFALGQSKYYRLIFMEDNTVAFRNASPELKKHSGETFQFLVDRTSEAIDAGIISEADPQYIALQIWSLIHGMLSLQLMGRLRMSRKQFDDLYKASFENFLQGVQNGS